MKRAVGGLLSNVIGKVKRTRKRVTKRRIKSKIQLALCQGFAKSQHKIPMYIRYGYDSDGKAGYILEIVRGSTPWTFAPAGSIGNPGGGGTFTFGTGRGGMSAPTSMSVGFLLGTKFMGNSFSDMLSRFRWYKISGVNLKISSIMNKGSSNFLSLTGTTVPQTINTFGNLPNMYFSFVDTQGLLQTDIGGYNTQYIYGYPQRFQGALKYRPHASNDKYPVSRYFKAGKWFFPPQYLTNNDGEYYTVGSCGHWSPCFTFALNDPAPEYVPQINGALLMGWEPTIAVPALTWANVNDAYKNTFSFVGEMEIIFDVKWMGEFDFTEPLIS